MNYDEIITKFKELTIDKTDDDIENFLGYLYYDSDSAIASQRFSFEDLEKAINGAKSIDFTLLGGENISELILGAIETVKLGKVKLLKSLIINIIGSDELQLSEIDNVISIIESGVNCEDEFMMLMGMVNDNELGEKAAIALLVVQ